MNIMNKLYKCALGLLTTFILTCCCISSADYLDGFHYVDTVSGNGNSVYTLSFSNYNFPSNGDFIFCGKVVYSQSSGRFKFTQNQNSYDTTLFQTSRGGGQNLFCIQTNKNTTPFYIMNSNGGGIQFTLDMYYLDSYSIISGDPGYTSLECQTEYNLIPISEVTANYCKLNFDLIDPMECPINNGTGAIVRSNLTINNTPYAQNQNINVFIPDFLAWNVAFNDFNTVIEVEGYNADESYIENVISNEKLTPTNEDFEQMLTGFMTNYFPYLALALVFLYLARKIFKLFK